MEAQRRILIGETCRLIAVAALAAAGCSRDGAAAPVSAELVAASGTLLSCTQTDPGRPANRQSVSASIDAAGALVNVVVMRGPSRRAEHVAATSVVVPGYQDSYFEQTYHLTAWNIGSEGDTDYFLLLPDSGILTGTFAAQLHVYFSHGDAGWWQKILSCTAQ